MRPAAARAIGRAAGIGARLATGLACLALGACATLGAGGAAGSGTADDAVAVDWPAYGAAIRSEPPAERLRLYAEANDSHRLMPTADSAIRLAVLAASLPPADRDLEAALALLDFAAANLGAGDTAGRDFVRFYRPLVGDLHDGQRALAAETEARQALARQLDALREIESQLNADDPDR